MPQPDQGETLQQRDRLRNQAIIQLAQQAPHSGRLLNTSLLMDLTFLLQQVHRIPLGYRFTLSTQGPRDPQVLQHLSHVQAEQLITLTHHQDSHTPTILTGPRHPGAADDSPELARAVRQTLEDTLKLTPTDISTHATILTIAGTTRPRTTPPPAACSDLQLARAVVQLRPNREERHVLEAIGLLRKQGFLPPTTPDPRTTPRALAHQASTVYDRQGEPEMMAFIARNTLMSAPATPEHPAIWVLTDRSTVTRLPATYVFHAVAPTGSSAAHSQQTNSRTATLDPPDRDNPPREDPGTDDQ